MARRTGKRRGILGLLLGAFFAALALRNFVRAARRLLRTARGRRA